MPQKTRGQLGLVRAWARLFARTEANGPLRRYQKVLWHHELADEPVVLYSKIDAGFEVREVEVCRDGRLDYADGSASTGTAGARPGADASRRGAE